MPAKDGVSKYANKRTDFNKVSTMTLSADTLNQRSPYALMQLGELTFRFVTDQQIHYIVGFYKDTIFMDDEPIISSSTIASTSMAPMTQRYLKW